MPDITVNGESRFFSEGNTVSDLLVTLGVLEGLGLIVERNGAVVPRGGYSDVVLADGDNVEVIRVMGGG